jgi:hypothetical protein
MNGSVIRLFRILSIPLVTTAGGTASSKAAAGTGAAVPVGTEREARFLLHKTQLVRAARQKTLALRRDLVHIDAGHRHTFAW